MFRISLTLAAPGGWQQHVLKPWQERGTIVKGREGGNGIRWAEVGRSLAREGLVAG